MTNHIDSAQVLLETAYTTLGFDQGELVNTDARPTDLAPEQWIEKGDWITLAKKVGAEKVFFVNNDPVIVFAEHKTEDANLLRQVFNNFWCMARPRLLFLARQGELTVYDLTRPPVKTADEWKKIKPLFDPPAIVAEVATKLHACRREQVESGRLFEDERFGKPEQRADQSLIRDLKAARAELIRAGLSGDKVKYAHALIGRSIFIRYLEDRKILIPDYFEKVASQNQKWQPKWQALLDTPPHKADLDPKMKKLLYPRVLADRDFTYALFDQLAHDFNGDMFPSDSEEKKVVEQMHLDLLQGFLLGETGPQQTLFFWAYKFEIIPIALISSIYEEFYHGSNEEDDNGTHYTPNVLVEYVLSQVLTQERLATNPRILDPACGSGIFLVESFRRIVRYRWVQQLGRMPSPGELRQILRDQICGIEINSEATHVAAFSLYLALLHYQETPDILNNKRLPNLIYSEGQQKDEQHYHVIFNANAFGLTPSEEEELRERIAQKRSFAGRTSLLRLLESTQKLGVKLHSFDVIVGNPPWYEAGSDLGSISCDTFPALNLVPKPFEYNKKTHALSISRPLLPTDLAKAKQSFPKEFYTLLNQLKAHSDECFQAEQWAEAYNVPVGDKSYSQLFIHRALALVKENGIIGLLVHSSVLFNQRKTSQDFRRAWLASSKLYQVVNFAHVRTLFFDKAIAPFVFVCFQPAKAVSEDSHFIYTSARFTKAVERLRAVILTKDDRRIVRQAEIMHRDYLWKTYWWGSHRDAALLAALELEQRLQDILKDTDPPPAYGYQLGSESPSKTLRILKSLKSESLKWYGPLRVEWFEEPPKGVKRQPDEKLYRGQRLLVVRGIKGSYGVYARLEHEEFSFRHTIYCVPLPSLPKWQAKLILGIFWSSVGRYKLFMTSASWGTWYDQTVPWDILSMPIKIPKQNSPLVQRIVSAVDSIRAWSPSDTKILENIGPRDEFPPKKLQDDLDEAIFDLFELSEPERDLIDDFVKYKFDLFSKGANSTVLERVRNGLKTFHGTIRDLPIQQDDQNELAGYLYTFLQIWNRELEPEGEFRWRVIRPPNVSMLAVVFTTQTKNTSLPDISISDQEEWIRILKRCDEALLQPISRRIYIDGIVRAVTDTDIFIIKRDERRLWTRSMAREDAEAALLQAMHLQAAVQER